MFCFYFFISERTFDDVFQAHPFYVRSKEKKSVLRFLRFVCDFSKAFLRKLFFIDGVSIFQEWQRRVLSLLRYSCIDFRSGLAKHSPSQLIYDKFHHKTEEFHLMFSLCLVLCLRYVCGFLCLRVFVIDRKKCFNKWFCWCVYGCVCYYDTLYGAAVAICFPWYVLPFRLINSTGQFLLFHPTSKSVSHSEFAFFQFSFLFVFSCNRRYFRLWFR